MSPPLSRNWQARVMLANASIQETTGPSRVRLFAQIAPFPIKMLNQRERRLAMM
jgi:hypothetical protein